MAGDCVLPLSSLNRFPSSGSSGDRRRARSALIGLEARVGLWRFLLLRSGGVEGSVDGVKISVRSTAHTRRFAWL